MKDYRFTAEDVCWLNQLQKASRQVHWSQEDNAIDAAGYAFNALACAHAQRIEESENEALRDHYNRALSEAAGEAQHEYCRKEEQGCDLKYDTRSLHGVSVRDQRISPEREEADRLSDSESYCSGIPTEALVSELLTRCLPQTTCSQ